MSEDEKKREVAGSPSTPAPDPPRPRPRPNYMDHIEKHSTNYNHHRRSPRGMPLIEALIIVTLVAILAIFTLLYWLRHPFK